MRFRVSDDGRVIMESRRLHDSITEYSVRTARPASALLGREPVVSGDTPEDTDVFHVLQRRPAIPELMVLSQSLPITGGSFFVASGIQRVDVGGDQASRLYSSSPVTVGITQKIFRPNALKWDSREQDLVALTADRQYLEAREDVALAAANAFFDVHSARLALDNAVGKVAINDTLFGGGLSALFGAKCMQLNYHRTRILIKFHLRRI